MQGVQFLVDELLDRDEGVPGVGEGPDQLIELGRHGLAIPIQRVLDQGHHQDGAMIVPVLMTSYQVSENLKIGAETTQASGTTAQIRNPGGFPWPAR
jgi:hypothetical protein